MDKLTYDIIKNKIESLKLKLVSTEYSGANEKLIIQDENNYLYFVAYRNIVRNSFDKFHVSNPYTIHNVHNWCLLNNKDFDIISEKYEDHKTKLEWYCKKCHGVFRCKLNSILDGKGCGICRGFQVCEINSLATNRPDLKDEWHSILNALSPNDVTCGSGKIVWWKCKDCSYEWPSEIKARALNDVGCPICSKSKGEKRIARYLKYNNIIFDTEYSFEDLTGINNGELRFDFVIFENNNIIKCLIEYDGEQHFKLIKGLYTYEKYQYLKHHDKLKNQYCKQNNISLIRIPYWDYNNIENILAKELNLLELKEVV